MEEQKPRMIGKYKIEGLVAKGGMGAVYKAPHPSLKDVDVILKRLTIRNNKTVRERFEREARLLLGLQSPYIVHVFDYFIEGTSHYIVEEFVDGVSLAGLIEKQVSLGTELSLLIFLDVCYALKFAHHQGIVHRDIKPGNILISRRAEVKLADFGIASSEKGDDLPADKRAVAADATVSDNGLTRSGVTLGTPAYMAPEQMSDSRSVDKRADIFSMGIMLYEMLTGARPFPPSLTASTLDKIRRGKYVDPRKIDRTIPRSVCYMIRRMIKAKPSQRYQSIDPVIDIIKRRLLRYDTHKIRIALAQSVRSPQQYPVPVFQPKKQVGRLVALAVTAATALVAGVAWLWSEGAVHATLLRHWYTPVRITMALPTTTSAASDLPARAFFFIDDGDALPEVQGSRRVFVKPRRGAGLSGATRYRTKPVYVRAGAYRIKVAVGPYVVWQSLLVGREDVDVDLEDLQYASRELKIHAQAFDSEIGTNITALTSFTIFYKDRWIALADIPAKELVTGSVWKITASCRGYKTAVFSLLIDWYQDDLRIVARLQKEKK